MSEKTCRFGISKVSWSIIWVIAILLIVELALQLRSHVRYGTSVFNTFANQTSYNFNQKYQLNLLRPNSLIQGSQSIIKSNSLGLRSPELSLNKQADELRIAILGASTVMGTYTRNNEEVLSYRLENYLQKAFPEFKVHIINAGIAGYSLDDQQKMFERVLKPFDLDLLIWYPGFNDISGYCRRSKKIASYGLAKLQLPKWLLSIDLIKKNTVWLRSIRIKKNTRDNVVDSVPMDLVAYQMKLNKIFENAISMKVPLFTVTNARAFRREMPVEEQMNLSETARYYNHCFDLEALHNVYDQHNDLIAAASLLHKNPVLRLDRIMPGGSDYFGDATHFSVFGTNYVARLLAEKIVSLQIIPTVVGITTKEEQE